VMLRYLAFDLSSVVSVCSLFGRVASLSNESPPVTEREE
jgi:hypothetical protein